MFDAATATDDPVSAPPPTTVDVGTSTAKMRSMARAETSSGGGSARAVSVDHDHDNDDAAAANDDDDRNLDEDDDEAHKGWTALVSDMLGGVDEGSGAHGTFSLMDPKNIVFTGSRGIQAIEDIQLGDEVRASGDTWSRVIGIVEGIVEGAPSSGWMASCIEASRYRWKRVTTLANGTVSVRGKHIITNSGVFRVVSSTGYAIVRDFTEVGADKIGDTYSFVASSLR
jgi:hypothetical protein